MIVITELYKARDWCYREKHTVIRKQRTANRWLSWLNIG